MEQDKEAWMIKAVWDCVTLLSQAITLLIPSSTLFRSVKCREKFESWAQIYSLYFQAPQLQRDADLNPENKHVLQTGLQILAALLIVLQ